MTATVFVLTGAGISAESRLGTFRDPDGTGMWARFDPALLATPEAFADDPDRVHAFYNARRRNLLRAGPNAAHHALAALEETMKVHGGRLVLVTQNIDDLHERAGSGAVLHMHGELRQARCSVCGDVARHDDDLGRAHTCRECNAAGAMRPDVVWFGEMPRFLDEIAEALASADLFVAIGTSGSVYPAAGLVAEARALGISTCEINLEPSDNASQFDRRRYSEATQTVPAWTAELAGALDAGRPIA